MAGGGKENVESLQKWEHVYNMENNKCEAFLITMAKSDFVPAFPLYVCSIAGKGVLL